MGRGAGIGSEIAVATDLIGFHASPNDAQASLLMHGIDPRRSTHGRWNEADSGFFCFLDEGEARWYAETQALTVPAEPFDLWQLTLDPAVLLHKDFSLFLEDSHDNCSSYYVEQPLGKQRVKLISTYWPNVGWR